MALLLRFSYARKSDWPYILWLPTATEPTSESTSVPAAADVPAAATEPAASAGWLAFRLADRDRWSCVGWS